MVGVPRNGDSVPKFPGFGLVGIHISGFRCGILTVIIVHYVFTVSVLFDAMVLFVVVVAKYFTDMVLLYWIEGY